MQQFSRNLIFLLSSITILCSLAAAQDFTCSASKPCELGCCSKDGFCGLGPDFCGAGNCISSCDQKSECDPGWGAQWSAKEKCPLNVCCSRFGFCGTTPEFCGTNTVTNPSCSGKSAEKRTIGYFESWGVGRPCDALFPEQIKASAYTHINFAFAFIDPVTFNVAPMNPNDPDLYRRLIALKSYNPGLQIWISFGGWTFTDDDQPTRHTFSDLAASTANQQKFFSSLVSFMSTYGFDGIDIDWEYPAADDRNGRPEDYSNFVSLMQNLRAYFKGTGHNYGVTVTLPTSFWYLQHFDVVNLEKTVDWFNIMSYDLAGTWDAQSVWRGPYVRAHTNLTEIDQALKLLWRNNINPANVVLGLGFYGRSFTLADPSCKTTGCPFSEGGPPGECTGESGTLSYAEIQRRIARGARPVLDSVAAVQTLVYDNDYWVSFDDATTFKMKYDYANNNCLGGMMVWAASLDTPDAAAAGALRTTQVADPSNFRIGIVLDTTSSCVWTNCGESCPSGYGVAALSGGGQATSGRRCGKGVTRSFCCPSNNLPTCSWNLYNNGAAKAFGVCQKKCGSDQIAVGTDTHGCTSGHGTLCCENKNSVRYIGQCVWAGGAPTCAAPSRDAGCPGDKPSKLTHSSVGDGGEQQCFTGWKSLCCTDPPPYKNCGWYKSAKWYDWFFALCDGTCPAGKTVVAVDPWAAGCTGWGTGPGTYCCDPPVPPGSSSSNPTVPQNPELTEWETSVKGWLATGVCQEESGSDDPDLKRLLVRDVRENGTLATRQALDPKWQNTAIAAKLLLIVYQSQNNRVYSDMASIWDRVMSAAGSTFNQLTISNLKGVLDFPLGDKQPVLSQILCERDSAQRTVLGMLNERSHICQVPPDGGVVLRPIKKRSFTDSFNPDQQTVARPPVGRVLRRLADGRLRPEYFRWFRYQTAGQFELEVVYLLGPNANQLDNTIRQTITNANGQDPDAFVILHIHINRESDWGLEVNQINVRHGRYMRPTFDPGNNPPTANNPSAGNWRAQNSAGRGTEVFACPVNQVWEIGQVAWETNIRNPQVGQEILIEQTMWTVHLDLNEIFNGAFTPATLAPFLTRDGRWNQSGPSQSRSYTPDGRLYNPYATGDLAPRGFIDATHEHN